MQSRISHWYDDYDAIGLAELVRNKEITAEELLNEALTLTKQRNDELNAVVLVQEEEARKNLANLPDGVFKGVPFLLKDCGGEAIGFPAHNGSNILMNTTVSQDSELVARMRKTGLVFFGRSTAPEGAVGPATEAAVYGGPTRNPWGLDRTPGGSSGGAAAAVAAGIVPAAHGSDGGGSIRIPASSCGVFGFKATRARLPDGPYAGEGWAGMAIEGYLSRSVRDTAYLLDATCGPDLGTPYYAPPLNNSFTDSLKMRPKNLRIAMLTTSLTGKPVSEDCRIAVEEAAQLLTDMGHHVEEAMPVADTEGMFHAWTDIVACGTALWVQQTIDALGRKLKEGDIEPLTQNAYEYAQSITGAQYLDAVETVHKYGRQMAAFFENYDILLTPTLAEPPAKIGRFGHWRSDYYDYRTGPDGVFNYSPFTAPFNATGQPAASVPLHWNKDGLPIGIQLAGRFGEDDVLMALCANLEEAKPWFKKRPEIVLRGK